MKKILFGLFGLLFTTPVFAAGGWLPSGYTELEYIESTGTQYINTGVVPTLDYSFEIKAVKQVARALIGSGEDTYTLTGGSQNFLYTSGNKTYLPDTIDNSLVHVWAVKGNKLYCDNISVDIVNKGTQQLTLTWALFGRHVTGNVGNDIGSHKIYYAKLYNQSGTLVRNFIPARNASGVVGMYDTVNDQFYTNAGTGTFIAGPTLDGCRNLLDFSAFNQYSNWSASMAGGGDMPASDGNRMFVLPNIVAGRTYTISFAPKGQSDFPQFLYFGYVSGGNGYRIAYLTAGSIQNTKYTFTAESGKTYVLRIGGSDTSVGFADQISKISWVQLEQGSTATNYVPYNPYCQNSCKNLTQRVIDTTYTGGESSVGGDTITDITYQPNTQYTITIDVEPQGDITYSENGNLLWWNIQYTDDSTTYSGITHANYEQGRVSITTDPGKTVRSIEGLMKHPRWTGGTLKVSNLQIKRTECTQIQIATTKHVTGAFSGLNSQLTAAIATVNSVVTNTIDQANRIAALATGKQTRPTDTCPQYRQCLLVEGTDGTPHWYEINDPFYNFFAPILATNTNGTSYTNDPGYQQVEYIESTGTQYIDTGFVATSDNLLVRAKLSSTANIAAGGVGGAVVGGKRTLYPYFSSTILIGCGGDIDTSVVPSFGTLYDVEASYNGTTLKWNINGTTGTSPASTGINGGSYYLFAINTGSAAGYYWAGRIYSYAIYQNNTLVRNMIPVRRLSDSAVGMYDTVSKTFFANAGSGSFTAGPNVTNDSDVPSGPNWSVTWTNNGNSASGTVYGEGKCNASSSDVTNNTAGVNCWCRVTGLTSGGDTNTTDNGAWVFSEARSSAAGCASLCASSCAYAVRDDASFRSAVFNVVN